MATCIAPQAFETIQMELQSSSENVGKVMLDVYFVGEDGQTKVDPSDPHSSMVATHRSLKRALDNRRSLLKIHESSSCELLNDTAKHYLIKWQLESVVLNTCVISYGEATSATLKNQISSDNPAIIAANRAQDRAIISLLGLITDKPVYSDSEISPGMYPSATALRAALLSDENCSEMPLGPDDFMPEIINSIQRTDNLQEYLDCDEAIAARLKKSDFHYNSFEEMVKDIKTREYTYTRIARAIIHIYLQIKKPAKEIKSAYLIGFKSPELLTELKNRSQLQIISKAADYREELESTARAAELYNTVLWKKYKVEYPNIYQQKIIKCS